jgi:hypothetical protein
LPQLIRQLFGMDQRIAPRLTLAQQYERSPWLGRMTRVPYVGEQLALSSDLCTRTLEDKAAPKQKPSPATLLRAKYLP